MPTILNINQGGTSETDVASVRNALGLGTAALYNVTSNPDQVGECNQVELQKIDDLTDKINCLMQEYSNLKTQLKIYEQNILNIITIL